MTFFQLSIGLIILFSMVVRPFLYKPCAQYFPAELSVAFTSVWLMAGLAVSWPVFGHLLTDDFKAIMTSPYLLFSLLKGVLLWFMIKLQQLVNRESTSSSVFFGFVAMALAWMLCVTGWQTVLGLNNLRMLRVYRHDPQGVTVFAALPTGPFHYATCHGTYNKFHWMLFRRESGLAHDPIALTPWLYATLYHAPADFFAMAREVRPGIFVAPRAPRLAVLRGERPPEALCTAAQAWLAASSPQASGWRRFVPGRFRVMFPPEDFQLYIPGNHATITAADGQAYTLVTAPKPKP